MTAPFVQQRAFSRFERGMPDAREYRLGHEELPMRSKHSSALLLGHVRQCHGVLANASRNMSQSVPTLVLTL